MFEASKNGDVQVDEYIDNLVGCRETIDGNLRIENVGLRTFRGGPKHVGGSVFASGNLLLDLQHSPRIVGKHLLLTDNKLLHSLNGAPDVVNGHCFFEACSLTSLKGLQQVKGNIFLSHNPITSLRDVHHHIDNIKQIHMTSCPIKSHVLGLLLINGLEYVGAGEAPWVRILKRHLPSKGMESVLLAQEELILAGLEEYAQI